MAPYSRFADGRKVLRSSIREFLCSGVQNDLYTHTVTFCSVLRIKGARQVHSNTNQDNFFFKGKRSCPGWDSTHDTLLSRQSALPTELPGQLSKQGSKSTIQHNTRQSQTPILCAIASTWFVLYVSVVCFSAIRRCTTSGYQPLEVCTV